MKTALSESSPGAKSLLGWLIHNVEEFRKLLLSTATPPALPAGQGPLYEASEADRLARRGDACASIPFHRYPFIQPHGCLFVLDDQLRILQVSENIVELLHVNVNSMLGSSVLCLFDQAFHSSVRKAVASLQTDLSTCSTAHTLRFALLPDSPFIATACRVPQSTCVILEIEPKVPSDITILEAINRVASVGAKLQACEDRNASKEELLGVVVQDIHDFLHFPLNMILKFHPDWHGEVVSEIADIPDYSYFGMHFPATDIPAQVRETYKKCTLRYIPDVLVLKVPLVPESNVQTNEPVDLTHTSLRMPHFIHTRYIHNMKSRASTTVSLIVNGELWGLLCCHDNNPHYLSPAMRMYLLHCGLALNKHLSSLILRDVQAKKQQLSDVVNQFQTCFLKGCGIIDCAEQMARELKELLHSSAIVGQVLGREFSVCDNNTPSYNKVFSIIKDLRRPSFCTTSIKDYLPELLCYSDELPVLENLGGCVFQIDELQGGLFVVAAFREKVERQLRWAGDPTQPFSEDEHGPLQPRSSFAEWVSTIRGQCLEFNKFDQEAICAVFDVGMTIAALLNFQTTELEPHDQGGSPTQALQSNGSSPAWDSESLLLAQVMRTPLSALAGALKMFEETHMSPEQRELLDIALQCVQDILAARTQALAMRDIDSVVFVLRVLAKQRHQELVSIVDPALPDELIGDGVAIRRILVNLLSNAIKFTTNDGSGRILLKIEAKNGLIHEDKMDLLISVQDNGCGIPQESFTSIFRPFEMSDESSAPPERTTRLGLALVKGLVTILAGRVWLESQVGKGTTFYVEIPVALPCAISDVKTEQIGHDKIASESKQKQ